MVATRGILVQNMTDLEKSIVSPNVSIPVVMFLIAVACKSREGWDWLFQDEHPTELKLNSFSQAFEIEADCMLREGMYAINQLRAAVAE